MLIPVVDEYECFVEVGVVVFANPPYRVFYRAGTNFSLRAIELADFWFEHQTIRFRRQPTEK